jgi:tetratricopeptide (TPR) repeat protein
MRRASAALLALAVAGCATTLESGERLYREGDRLGALEVWRAASEDDPAHPQIAARIAVVEEEFTQLVVRYKKRASYFEAKDRLAESILNYRLALKLQPDDDATLAHVQQLARTLAARKAELKAAYRESLAAKDLAAARLGLDRLRTLDPFDPQLETDQRQLDDALRAEVTRGLTAGRRGFSSGNYRRAERAFRAVLALDPENESARGYLSYIATIRRESPPTGGGPAAFDASEPFATDAEIRAEGFYQNGLASEQTGDFYTAIRHYLRALDANSGHRSAGRQLADLRRRLAGEVDPLIEAGRSQFRNEDLQSALDLWRRALLIAPGNQRARAYIARAQRQLENLERLRAEPDMAGGQE